MILYRKKNWSTHIDKAIADTLTKKFHWEDSNCGFFVADIGMAILENDYDIASEARGIIVDEESSTEFFNSRGVSGPVEYLRRYKYIDIPEIHPSESRLGDICVVEVGGEQALMINSIQCLTGMSLKGRVILPRRRAITAFRLGEDK